jgi:hypothetical protein
MSLNVYQEIVAVVGRDAALKLICKWGNDVIYLPKLTGYQGPSKEVRQICDLYRMGWSPTRISQQLCLEPSTIIDVLEVSLTSEAYNNREVIQTKQDSW